MNNNDNPFELNAESYDRWFDSADGKVIFASEVNCLKNIIGETNGRWLEVGVGTGRFANALNIGEGIDPSPAVLGIAEGRGIQTYMGYGEKLPFPDKTFDGILIAFSICFMKEPSRAIGEAFRVLKETGRLIVGFIPADSVLGKIYEHKGKAGHLFYSNAVFWTKDELATLITKKGFILENMETCFLPESENVSDEKSLNIDAMSDFIAIAFSKQIERK